MSTISLPMRPLSNIQSKMGPESSHQPIDHPRVGKSLKIIEAVDPNYAEVRLFPRCDTYRIIRLTCPGFRESQKYYWEIRQC